MSDKEKVIKGIECHRKKVQTTNSVSCLECPYSEPKPIREWCMSGLMDDIYALLKEQEAVKPEVEVLNEIDRLYKCPRCHKHFFYEKQKYCDQCGQEVKWE